MPGEESALYKGGKKQLGVKRLKGKNMKYGITTGAGEARIVWIAADGKGVPLSIEDWICIERNGTTVDMVDEC